MVSERVCRFLALVFCVLTGSATIYYSVSAYSNYQTATEDVADLQDTMHFSLIRTTAADGTPLKALLTIQPDLLARTDHSVPLMIIHHGMSSSYFDFSTLQYTFAKRGYAVVSPEGRGHGSNPAPSTLGYLEPYDILTWLDYVEDNFPAVNVSASGLFAHSMGAMFATSAYVYESMGQGRFKGLVAVSGPLNVTREYAYLSNKPEALGDIPFVSFNAEKNPVNYMNSTFPSNFLLFHGTQDEIVDYRCTTDAVAVLDPTGTRNGTDMAFFPIQGGHHNIMDVEFVRRTGLAFLELRIRGLVVDPDTIDFQSTILSTHTAQTAKEFLLKSVISCSLFLPVAIYALKPSWYLGAHRKRHDPQESPLSSLPTNYPSDIISKTDRPVIIFGGFVLVSLVAGGIAALTRWYIANELILSALAIWSYLAFLTFSPSIPLDIRKHRQQLVRDQVGLRPGLLWAISLSAILPLYSVISSSPAVEDATLQNGSRVTWWIPFITITLMAILLGLWVLVKIMRSSRSSGKQINDTIPSRMKRNTAELFLFALCGAIAVILCMISAANATFSIPVWNLGGYIAPVVAVIFGGLFLLFGLGLFLTNKLIKTPIPVAIGAGFLVAFFAAAGDLIFFY
jgi:pimeloyl-ACP methyl ester carboxylesterase